MIRGVCVRSSMAINVRESDVSTTTVALSTPAAAAAGGRATEFILPWSLVLLYTAAVVADAWHLPSFTARGLPLQLRAAHRAEPLWQHMRRSKWGP